MKALIAPRGPFARAVANVAAVKDPIGVLYRHSLDVGCLVAYTAHLWLLLTFPTRAGSLPAPDVTCGDDWRVLPPVALDVVSKRLRSVKDPDIVVALDDDLFSVTGTETATDGTTFTARPSGPRDHVVIRQLMDKHRYRAMRPVPGTFALTPALMGVLGRLKSESTDHPVDCKIVEIAPGRQAVAFVRGPNIFGLAPAVDRAVAAEADLLTGLDGEGPMSWMW